MATQTSNVIRVRVREPETVSVQEPEEFVIDGICYQVCPDVTGKVQVYHHGARVWVWPSKGFAGREFVILTDDGRRIVSHNVWMGDEVDGPDNARFEGAAARPVPIRRDSRYE